MSEFKPEKKVSTDFNSGVEYRNKVDSPSAEDFNNVIEYLLYLGEQNVVTVDTAQTITGEKVFTSPLYVRGEGYSYVTISNDGYIDISSEERSQYPIYLNSYGITIRDRDSGISRTKFFPEIGERNETFSTREWVKEQYNERVTQNARNIQSLLAMQAKTVMEQTLTDSYTARQTADGALNIVDGALTYPTKIQGSTVKSKNLLNVNAFELGVFDQTTGLPVSSTSQFRTKYKIPCSEGAKIVQSNNRALTCRVFFYRSDDSFVSTVAMLANATVTVPTDATYLRFTTGAIGNAANLYDYKYQLEYGETATEYVPYFNGLKNAYFKGVKSTGKNLFNEKYIQGAYGALDGVFGYDSAYVASKDKIEVIGGQNYYIYYKPKSTETVTYVIFYDKNGKYLSYLYNPKAPFVAPENCAYINIDVYKGGANLTVNDIGQCMVVMSSVANANYVPYVEPDTSFSYIEAQQLKEWDYLLPQEGKKVIDTGVMILDGSADENWIESSSTDTAGRYWTNVFDNIVDQSITERAIASSQEFKYKNFTQNVGTFYISSGRHSCCFNTDKTKYPTLDDWKTHLAELASAGTPLTVAYKTVTATEVDLKPEKSSYFAYNDGSETVDEGETKNSEFGAKVTIEQDYFVWIGGNE